MIMVKEMKRVNPHPDRTITYRQAGVDRKKATDFVRLLQRLAERTHRSGVVQGIGGFGGLFALRKDILLNDPVLVASADGVGTKLLLARRAAKDRWGGRSHGWYKAIGIDLVAMNVNDILCTGAVPLFFLDYMAVGRLDPLSLKPLIEGMVEGCLQARCVLLGGETAQMGLLYRQGEFDLAGFAVGVVSRRHWIHSGHIRPGDRLLGLASNGPHANGFSLIQKAMSLRLQRRWIHSLLAPTRIYVQPVHALLKRKVPIHGIAHITGGSFPEKLGRILPHGCRAVLEWGSWRIPDIFLAIRQAGVSSEEMMRTFNLGIGMILVLPQHVVGLAQKILKVHGLQSWLVGWVESGDREVVATCGSW
jgi:phosphoribosylformylglycinamidine cyclo-ligase